MCRAVPHSASPDLGVLLGELLSDRNQVLQDAGSAYAACNVWGHACSTRCYMGQTILFRCVCPSSARAHLAVPVRLQLHVTSNGVKAAICAPLNSQRRARLTLAEPVHRRSCLATRRHLCWPKCCQHQHATVVGQPPTSAMRAEALLGLDPGAVPPASSCRCSSSQRASAAASCSLSTASQESANRH